MVAIALGYLLIGVLIMAWSLIDMIRTKQTVEDEDGAISDRRAITQMPPTLTISVLLFLATLWPIAVIAKMLWRADTEEDPQDRVPPEYR